MDDLVDSSGSIKGILLKNCIVGPFVVVYKNAVACGQIPLRDKSLCLYYSHVCLFDRTRHNTMLYRQVFCTELKQMVLVRRLQSSRTFNLH